MARERLRLGGVDVADLAIRAIDLSGTLQVPERRGANIAVDGRHGSIHVSGKKYNGRQAPFEFWLRGTLPDGTVPADPRSEFYDNLHRFAQLLAQDRLLMEHGLPDGSVREILVEARAAIEPNRFRTGDLARIGVVFEAAEAFWQAQVTTDVELELLNGEEWTLAEYAPSDAPIDDAVVTFEAGSAPRLTQVDSGLFVAYDAVIPSGRELLVDNGRRRLTGAGGLVPDRRLLSTHPTDGRWFAIDPVIGSAPTVRLQHNGGVGVRMGVRIEARQKWMFG